MNPKDIQLLAKSPIMKREKSLHGPTCIYDTGTTNKFKIPVVLTRLQEKSEDLFT